MAIPPFAHRLAALVALTGTSLLAQETIRRVLPSAYTGTEGNSQARNDQRTGSDHSTGRGSDGTATMQFELPGAQGLSGFPFTTQWASLDLAANAAGVAVSDAQRHTARFR